ncbi:MAG: hypothetical protein U5M72_05575 [Pseudomonas sp.]|nr:hypothetical protein [Pseudomonas sp.]
MNTTTQTTPAGGMLQLKMNMESLQLRVELKSLLQLFGAQTSLAELAITEFGGELRVEEAHEAGGSLYYLPLRLTPDFIDHILDQLCPDSRRAAIECLNKYRSAWSMADQDTAQMLEKMLICEDHYSCSRNKIRWSTLSGRCSPRFKKTANRRSN